MHDKGFLFAMPWKHKSMRLNEDMPPGNTANLQTDSQLRMRDFIKEEEFTQPPQYLQESDLIALMDKHGIGLCSYL